MPTPTQRDIAAYLGLNQSTVSRALQGKRASKELRAKIQEAAMALGYEPDPSVASLARYRWGNDEVPKGLTLACLTEVPDQTLVGLNHLRPVAEKAGYRLDVIDLNQVRSADSLLRVLRARGISGVLLNLDDTKPVNPIGIEVSTRFPTVKWNCRITTPICAGVIRDAHYRVADCCASLINKGYQRAMIILPGDPDAPTDWLRQMHMAWEFYRGGHLGWEKALFATYQSETWDAIADKVRTVRPEVLVVANEDVLNELEERNLVPRRDFAFACMDVKDGRTYSGIRTTFPLVARYSIELIENMISRRTVGSELAWLQVEVRGEWVDGDSL